MIDSLVLQDPVQMGYKGVIACVKSIRGEKVDKNSPRIESIFCASGFFFEAPFRGAFGLSSIPALLRSGGLPRPNTRKPTTASRMNRALDPPIRTAWLIGGFCGGLEGGFTPAAPPTGLAIGAFWDLAVPVARPATAGRDSTVATRATGVAIAGTAPEGSGPGTTIVGAESAGAPAGPGPIAVAGAGGEMNSGD